MISMFQNYCPRLFIAWREGSFPLGTFRKKYMVVSMQTTPSMLLVRQMLNSPLNI